jgi:hypothetical protein
MSHRRLFSPSNVSPPPLFLLPSQMEKHWISTKLSPVASLPSAQLATPAYKSHPDLTHSPCHSTLAPFWLLLTPNTVPSELHRRRHFIFVAGPSQPPRHPKSPSVRTVAAPSLFPRSHSEVPTPGAPCKAIFGDPSATATIGPPMIAAPLGSQHREPGLWIILYENNSQFQIKLENLTPNCLSSSQIVI